MSDAVFHLGCSYGEDISQATIGWLEFDATPFWDTDWATSHLLFTHYTLIHFLPETLAAYRNYKITSQAYFRKRANTFCLS